MAVTTASGVGAACIAQRDCSIATLGLKRRSDRDAAMRDTDDGGRRSVATDMLEL